MQTMFWPATIAMLGAALFLGAAGIFLLAIQYHRHGRLSWRRTLTTGAAVIYGFGLFSYTMLPLPETRTAFCRPGVAIPQLNPLNFLNDFALSYELGMRHFLTSFTLWQVLFNVILFMPLGILAVRWLRGNIFLGTFIGLTASLAIELTQYTGIWGLYTCAYRVADVDDVLTNTLGALIGSIVAYLPIFSWLTGPRESSAANAAPREVTRLRRFMANAFDIAFVLALVMLTTFVLEIAEKLGAPQASYNLTERWIPSISVLLVFLLPTLAPGRASLGQRCAWIRIAGKQRREASAWQALLRSLLGLGGISFAFQIADSIWAVSPWAWLSLLVLGYVVLSSLFLLFDRSGQGLAGRITGTRFVDRRMR
ncbi:hypothetical protein CQ019_05505 [Arthrobacter sp. MYb229]|uniref:VanZ family protein n=2 Tax=Micrococcales TaxID=85006 RepID=UPI000CFDD29D|nr:VanZ family protein [Arthrobacter sp. MYb229]PRA06819.1 hypothetical protein CQ019_05505 [Arthrobacter sp. MYb229]PRB53721.1 hypothetical protein CQ013_05505 [Arthrobacter sp. MYb216]